MIRQIDVGGYALPTPKASGERFHPLKMTEPLQCDALLTEDVFPMADTPETIYKRSADAYLAGDLGAADEHCRNFLTQQPGSGPGWLLHGRIRTRQSRLTEAETSLARAATLSPGDAEVPYATAVLRLRQGRVQDALRQLQATERLLPTHPGLPTARAQCYVRLGDPKKALEVLGEPKAVESCATAAEAALELGDAAKAEQFARSGLAMSPPPTHAYHLHQLLGRALARNGDVAGAFAAFTASRAAVPGRFNRDAAISHVDRMIRAFSPATVANLPRARISSKRPVFLVGTPRTGATLVEKIIASHPSGASAGETDALKRILVNWTDPKNPELSWPTNVSAIQVDRVDGVASAYLASTEQFAGENIERIADKTPGNWLYVGLMAIAFPEAAIVWVRRDPMDTGLSCFERLSTTTMPWAGRLEDIGLMLALNERMMEHWKSVFPGRITEIRYEDLVKQPEPTIRSLLSAIGLPWNDACMRHHQRTPRAGDAEPAPSLGSLDAARPIYQSSVGRAAKFAQLLEPMRAAYLAARAKG